jgi:translation initiation factor 3 subunit G
MNWGELEDDIVDENGQKHIIVYRTNDKGQKLKVTKTIQVTKVQKIINREVEERRKRWKKFGKCANSAGAELGVTSAIEELPFILGDEQRKYQERIVEEKRDIEEIKRLVTGSNNNLLFPGRPQNAQEKYKPPSRVTGGITGKPGPGGKAPMGPTTKAPGTGRTRPDDDATIRVTNLSEDTSDDDLRYLFRDFGSIQRIYLAKEKGGKSKGFAFVTFSYRESAQAAIDKLNGKGWEHVILNIEWAKPSTPQ